ncbi:enoyl-CoA hydratase-related protein [Halobacteriovorax sp. GB3]|uniref:enoyl-CoA hydratase-related protein n=1 Tax=Halobacteriovorax sp. GB3 TaxID=2719615 RepID=UPI00235E3702|nr:enoyl-CoA hydratase-related protein [Halobacteriovorax sp. GB3]MDD0853334.1 enoyl-CoA hydratase-related protein [Halobacteriovorax sp. GB3]
MSDLYLLDIDSRGVATVTLNRPELHNAFNDELIVGLTNEFLELEKNEKVRLIVLTGAGRSFCAGADLNWMKKMKDYSDSENYEDSRKLSRLFEVINSVTKPVIGKVNGHALGGGTGLVAVCDYVIAKEGAKIGFTEVLLGLVPAVISPYVMAKIGHSKARAYFLTGEKFGPEKAMEMELVHQVSLERYFEKDVEQVVSKFLMAAPGAQQVCKQLIQNVDAKVLDNQFESVIDYTCKTIAKQRTSEEGQEGMDALLTKRKPNWLEGV